MILIILVISVCCYRIKIVKRQWILGNLINSKKMFNNRNKKIKFNSINNLTLKYLTNNNNNNWLSPSSSLLFRSLCHTTSRWINESSTTNNSVTTIVRLFLSPMLVLCLLAKSCCLWLVALGYAACWSSLRRCSFTDEFLGSVCCFQCLLACRRRTTNRPSARSSVDMPHRCFFGSIHPLRSLLLPHLVVAVPCRHLQRRSRGVCCS